MPFNFIVCLFRSLIFHIFFLKKINEVSVGVYVDKLNSLSANEEKKRIEKRNF